MSVEVVNLTKIFNQQKAVNNITFSVKKGEILGFLGPNGAGKSTTIKMLTGQLNPDSGKAQVLGYDVSADDPAMQAAYLRTYAMHLTRALALTSSQGFLPSRDSSPRVGCANQGP